MNPTLVESIRGQMQARSTDQLLDLWVTNDQATWSAEAFEAVKSLLVERGMRELPRQHDPAPLAQRRLPGDDPDVAYWVGWVRPVLWVAIVVAILEMAEQAVGLFEYVHSAGRPVFQSPTPVIWGGVAAIILSAWLLVAAIGCLRVNARARTMLLAWAWVALTLFGWGIVYGIVREVAYGSRSERFLATDIRIAASFARASVLPVVLLFLFRRTEIRAAFTRASTAGFEPSLAHAEPAPTAALAGTPGRGEAVSY